MIAEQNAGPAKRGRSRILHRSLHETPPAATGGHGAWLVGPDGREVLDGSGGAAVSCLGHGHPRILEAIARSTPRSATSRMNPHESESLRPRGW